MSPTYTFNFPTVIQFGAGVRHQVAQSLLSQGFKHPLLVTDRGVAQQGFYTEFLAELGQSGLQVTAFTGIFGNPVKTQVEAGVAAYKQGNCDCMIGLGGGAALDVTKAIAVLVNHPGDLFEYEDKPGAKPIDQAVPYWVALPTTAGTGSEVGRSAVISDDQTHLKKIIFSPKLLARQIYADPELTLGLPAHITAATGMDALTHLVEAFLAKDYHPMCDGIALEGLRLVKDSLVKCVKHGNDLAARSDMLLASLMGAVAFQKGLGLTHSCAHALSTVADMHHGLANGIMIDHALKFNAEAVPERFERLTSAVGVFPTPEHFLEWLAEVKKEIGIPANLKEAGIKAEQIPALVEVAMADGCWQQNPRPCSRGDFQRIFEAALG